MLKLESIDSIDSNSIPTPKRNPASQENRNQSSGLERRSLDNSLSIEPEFAKQTLVKPISSMETQHKHKTFTSVGLGNSDLYLVCNQDSTGSEDKSDRSEESKGLDRNQRTEHTNYKPPMKDEENQNSEKLLLKNPTNPSKKRPLSMKASSFIPTLSTIVATASQQRETSAFNLPLQPASDHRRALYPNYNQTLPYTEIRRSNLPSKSRRYPQRILDYETRGTLWQDECGHSKCEESRRMALNCSLRCIPQPQYNYQTRFNAPNNSFPTSRDTISDPGRKVHTNPNHSRSQNRVSLLSASDTSQPIKLHFRSAFKLFKLDHIAQVKAEYPEAAFRYKMAVLKHRWKLLSSDSKYLYVKRSRLDKRKAFLNHQLQSVLMAQNDLKDRIPTDVQILLPLIKPEESLPSHIVNSLPKSNLNTQLPTP